LVKLLQLLKLKKNAQRNTAQFIVDILNSNENCPPGVAALFAHLKENQIAINDKEAFVLGNQTQQISAAFAFEMFKIHQSLPQMDMTLAFSLESLKVPLDYFTDFALTIGKSSQGAQSFKNNMQNLVTKSKLLAAKPPSDRTVLNKINLESTFANQIDLNQQVTFIKQQL
jgi:hypothetical protein